MEEFVPIKDFENYGISNLGNVKNIKRDKLMKTPINVVGYPVVGLYKDGKKKDVLVHRLVAQSFINNPDNKQYVDHINNNKLDNTISNLRWCTNQENARNIPVRLTSKSGMKGVCWDKARRKWHSSITVDGILINIGRFSTQEEAQAARILKARQVFGEFINQCEA